MNWDERFMELARHVATWSKDPSTNVGAVIIDSKRRIVASGYNGFPRGINDSDERLNDRKVKYSLVVHAETNAILNSTRADHDDCTLYVTHFPCQECAKLVIQSGIRRVVCPSGGILQSWLESQMISKSMFVEVGVQMECV